jgi:hypothetical protein
MQERYFPVFPGRGLIFVSVYVYTEPNKPLGKFHITLLAIYLYFNRHAPRFNHYRSQLSFRCDN